MEAIKATGLVKQYRNITATDLLHLEIRQGEPFSLLGVNGAGKTTTLKMLTCLTKPTAGDALVGGYSITKEPEQVKRLIGVSPQETAVAPNLSVQENLELICGIHGFSREKTREKIREFSGQFDLETVLPRKAGKLSGGMNVIYQVEKLPLMVAILIHGSVLYISYLATYLLNGWLEWGATPILVFSGIFILGYFIIWAVIYFFLKKNTAQLNKMLIKNSSARAIPPNNLLPEIHGLRKALREYVQAFMCSDMNASLTTRGYWIISSPSQLATPELIRPVQGLFPSSMQNALQRYMQIFTAVQGTSANYSGREQ